MTFYVLFDNGEDKPATIITVTADTRAAVQEAFPNAIRIVPK